MVSAENNLKIANFACFQFKQMRIGQAEVNVCEYKSGSGSDECFLTVRPDNALIGFEKQLGALMDAYSAFLAEMNGMVPVFERYFISDAVNQAECLRGLAGQRNCAVSIVEQPPLDGSKIALLAYLQENAEVRNIGNGSFAISRGGCRHLWSGGMTAAGHDSKQQTKELLVNYGEHLVEMSCSLAGNCVRTWFFVQNIDVNYAGVVSARNEVFCSQGLTGDTHFIASTGIGGRTESKSSYVMMDAYSIAGLRPGQMTYLYAPSHLNRTCEYGVSFERGTVVDYGDRRHLIISGTASIDNKGNVVYPGDVLRQTERMLENVGALLKEGGSSFGDVMYSIVYLRDIADYKAVADMLRKRFPDMPMQIVYAPVCRPGWLIEMECMAVMRQENDEYDVF